MIFGGHVTILGAGRGRMLSAMAEQQTPGAGQAGEEQQDEGSGWTWLDTAGVLAGAVLALIVIDIWADGRISRRLWNRLGSTYPEPEPEPEGPTGDG